jgi:GNAT superfamily N-acetyltransferase
MASPASERVRLPAVGANADDLDRRLLRTWAANAAAFVDVLSASDPAWRSETRPLAGGSLVLSGAGLYVNRAMAVGIDVALGDDEIDVVVERSRAVGVPPAVEVTPATHPLTRERLARRGFRHVEDADVVALVRSLPGGDVPAPADVVVRPVGDAAGLALCRQVSALGWGHVDADARHASDVFLGAAHAIDGDGLVLAFDAHDGRPLGCASTTIRNGVATLGGMSTIPAERRRGVQAALVRHRLALAVARGCAVAASNAVVGGASERNLRRLGFAERFVVETHRIATTS